MEEQHPYYETWWFEWLIVLACGFMGWTLWQVLAVHTGLGTESAQYLELGKSLAEGKGYSLFQTRHALPSFSIPPAYPLLVAVTMWLEESTAIATVLGTLKALNFGLYLISILLVLSFFQRQIRKPYPLLITALYALSPAALTMARQLNPDMLYLVLSLTALWLIDRYFAEKGPVLTRGQRFGCCFFIFWTIFTHNIGLALLAGFAVLALQRVGTKATLGMVGMVLLCMAPWYLGDVYFRALYPREMEIAAATPSPRVETATPSMGYAELALAETTQTAVGELHLENFDGVLTRTLALGEGALRLSDFGWIRWTVGILMLLGLLCALYQNSGIESYYLAAYLGAAWLLPVEKSRSLAPVLPLLIYHLYLGMLQIGDWLEKLYLPVGKALVMALTVLIVFNNLSGHLGQLRQVRSMQITGQSTSGAASAASQAVTSTATPPSPEAAYWKALRWLRAHTPRQSTVAALKPDDVQLFSERGGRALPVGATAEALLPALAGVDYVVESRQHPWVQTVLTPLLEQRPQVFHLVYNGPGIRIWRVEKTQPEGKGP